MLDCCVRATAECQVSKGEIRGTLHRDICIVTSVPCTLRHALISQSLLLSRT